MTSKQLKAILPIPCDPSSEVYEEIRKCVNLIMKDGQKRKALGVLTEAFVSMKQDRRWPKGERALDVFHVGVSHVCPAIEVRQVRRKGRPLAIPGPLKERRSRSLGLRWLIEGAKKRSPMKFSQALGVEILDAYYKEGYAVSKRASLHKLGVANRAYAHLRWWV